MEETLTANVVSHISRPIMGNIFGEIFFLNFFGVLNNIQQVYFVVFVDYELNSFNLYLYKHILSQRLFQCVLWVPLTGGKMLIPVSI